MAQFNTPVAVHYWNAVIQGVSRLNTFVDINLNLDTKGKWVQTLNTLHMTLPPTPDKTTTATAENTWNTLIQVQSEFDESSLTYETEHIAKVNQFITACKTRAKAFGRYCAAFTAFLKDSQCPLREYLKTQFPGHAIRICKELGALETKHLTFPEVSAYIKQHNSLTFLDIDLKPGQRRNKWILHDVLQELEPPPPAAPPQQQPPADPPRRGLVVYLSPTTKAHLEHMRACLLSM